MRNLVLTAAVIAKIQALRPGLSCYSDDEETLPRHCQPPFENIAFQKDIEASNTCGQDRPESYCVQVSNQILHNQEHRRVFFLTL